MNSSLALLICTVGIAGLFWLDRDKTARASKAVWLSVLWMGINASRSIAAWMAGKPVSAATATGSDSPADQFVAAALIGLGIMVIASRGRESRMLLRRSWPILIYFSYCLASALWSDFPGQGLKRWVKAVGELVMVLVIATDPHPITALKKLFSRVGFVLLPVSVLMLKYYPLLSHGYDQWGRQMNVGAATDKNMLGVGTFVLAMGALWQVIRLLVIKDQPNRGRHLLAQGILLGFGISLLFTAHSATAGACFVLGAIFMLAMSLPLFRRRPARVHALVMAILLLGGIAAALGGEGAAVEALGRNPDLTGRTEVWHLLLPMVPNPLLGAGFENFWFGPRVAHIWFAQGGIFYGINEAHDGYLEVYLNLGLIGVGLIVAILVRGYRSAIQSFRSDPMFGNLMLAYILTAVIYSITEAGFRMLDPIWFLLLLSVLVSEKARATAKEVTLQQKSDFARVSEALHTTALSQG